MNNCLYNAIKTPDGTILWCKKRYDQKTYKDTVSGEIYTNEGTQNGVLRSVNQVPYEDLSINMTDDFEKVRTAKFWTSYGKDAKSEERIMSLEEMEDSHIKAILATQKQIIGTDIEKFFLEEIKYRIEIFKDHLDKAIAPKNNKIKKIKI